MRQPRYLVVVGVLALGAAWSIRVGVDTARSARTVPHELSTVLRGMDADPDSLIRVWGKTGPAVWGLIVPGERAVECWKQLRAAVDRTGHWPFIIGDPELYGFDRPDESRQILDAARKVDLVAFEKHQAARYDLKEEESKAASDASPWPATPQVIDSMFLMTITYDHKLKTLRPIEKCLIGLAPTVDSTELPAYLLDAGFDPPPSDQIAMLRRWNERYGIEVVELGHCRMTLHVRNPPQTEIDSAKLAGEQFLFCNDSVYHTGTLRDLAIRVWKSPMWDFQWE